MTEQSRACVCTVISRSYMPFARVLIDSIRELHPELDVLVCVVDGDETDTLSGSISIDLDELLGEPGLMDMVYRYGRQSLIVAAKSPMLQAALRRGYKRALFLDVDMLVLAPLDELLDPNAPDILLTSHLLGPLSGEDALPGESAAELERMILLSGVYNGGCISVGASANATAMLDWLTSRLRVACRHDVTNGLHYDQTWLDLVPGMFDGVALLRDPGVNVAYWNRAERPVSRDANGAWRAGDAILRLYHFSGYDPRDPERPTRYRQNVRMQDLGDAEILIRDYHDRLCAAAVRDALELPNGLSTLGDGTRLTPELRRVLSDSSLDMKGLDPRTTGADVLRKRLSSTPDRVSPAWMVIWRERADLQLHFPDPTGEDRVGFDRWVDDWGRREHPDLFVLLDQEHSGDLVGASPRAQQ